MRNWIAILILIIIALGAGFLIYNSSQKFPYNENRINKNAPIINQNLNQNVNAEAIKPLDDLDLAELEDFNLEKDLKEIEQLESDLNPPSLDFEVNIK